MIKKLEIQNFQSHEDSKLQFHPGVNVIIGTSDSGKSAIMRALRWVCTGVPRGDSFRSWWGGLTAVDITVDENTISRQKADNDNLYLLNETEFRAFGTDVPEEILKALNLDEAVNIQRQLDLPYLISETPGAVAQHFNRMAQLEKIDRSRNYVNSKMREAEADLKAKQRELKEKQDDLLQYDYLEALEEKLTVLETRQERLENLQEENEAIQNLLTEVQEKQEAIDRAEKPLQAESAVDALLSKQSIVEEENKLKTALESLVEEIESVSTSIEKGTQFIKAENSIDSLLEKMQELKVLKNEKEKLCGIADNIDEVLDLESTEILLLEENEKKYQDNMPEECPICGTNCKHK